MIQFNNFKADYQYHQKTIDKAIQHVLNSGWYVLGGQVEQFEKKLANFSNTKYAVTVGNGLDALEISLLAHNIKKDDEVITSPVSAFATSLAILNTGAKPVFVDIDSETGLISTKAIQKAITQKTKVVLPVNLYGQMCDIKSIYKLCKQYNLKLIEDSAQSIGAERDNIKTGQLSHASCLSFYPTKNLGAYGDGGAIITNSTKVYEKAKSIRNYGQDSQYHHIYLGKNSRLDEIQAAILISKLDQLPNLLKKRCNTAKKYQTKISNPKIQLLNSSIGHTYHLFVIKTHNRDKLIKHLKKENITSLVHYPKPLYAQPAIKHTHYKNNCTIGVAEEFCNQILSIPIHPYLKKQEIETIINTLNNY